MIDEGRVASAMALTPSNSRTFRSRIGWVQIQQAVLLQFGESIKRFNFSILKRIWIGNRYAAFKDEPAGAKNLAMIDDGRYEIIQYLPAAWLSFTNCS